MQFIGILLIFLTIWADYAQAKSFTPKKVLVTCGTNIGSHVCRRTRALLSSVVEVEEYDEQHLSGQDGVLVLALGNSSRSLQIIANEELKGLGDEGYIVRATVERGLHTVAANGNPIGESGKVAVNPDVIHIGAVYSVYAALEELGFGFLHPLKPTVPDALQLTSTSLDIHEKPHWRFRGFHIHTEHPLELTDVLQGFDIPMKGPHGIKCEERSQATGNKYCERWEDMVDDVSRMFEWAVANKLNRIEWILLGSPKWGNLTDGDMRLERLQRLTDLGHSYGLLLIADVPVAEKQQHAWYMVNTRASWDEQVQAIHDRIDWLFKAGFDAMGTESGLSEFTHPDCETMLNLLNEYSTYTSNVYGREAVVKVHCSTGQTCPDYPDPRTGEPINFNLLPTYADPSLGVMPHTVQAYAVDDPTAGAYGNDNFTYMFDYLFYEAKQGVRMTVWYPETAYWVNVDVDVPLFLPLYGHRRLHDLRLIADRELEENVKIDGQMDFDSGWEWGYWLSDVITARASWNPMMDIKDEDAALLEAIRPFTKLLPTNVANEITDFIVDLVHAQSELLIYGRVNGEESPDLTKLSGFAYLSGEDTWVDLPRMLGVSFTQPDKVHMDETDDELYPYVLPLLTEMEGTFGKFADRISEIHQMAQQSGTQKGALELIAEINDAVQMLAQRAKLVRILYQSKSPDTDDNARAELLSSGRNLLEYAQSIVLSRESQYRVPWQRIADWHLSPTTYRYGFLWAVHSLYYWWRDQGLAEGGSWEAQQSPCYLNRIDSAEVPFGWGKYLLEVLRIALDRNPDKYPSAAHLMHCLAPPPHAYEFPRDLFVY